MLEIIGLVLSGAALFGLVIYAFWDLVIVPLALGSITWETKETEELEEILATGVVHLPPGPPIQEALLGIGDAAPMAPLSIISLNDDHRAIITEILAKRRQTAA